MDGDRKTGDKWFGKMILKAAVLVYLPMSSSWQQTKHMGAHSTKVIKVTVT